MSRTTRQQLTSLAALITTCAGGCSQPAAPPAPAATAQKAPDTQTTPGTENAAKAAPAHDSPRKLAVAHLPNAYQIHEKVITGGQPDGEQGFAELEQLGIKTVISVDGAKPAVDLAKQHGLRYVHLPHGYDGVPEERAKELAKAVRDLPGPIYIHCHHGKHRSPAAGAVACISAGLLAPQAGPPILAAAGTSKNYRGLYQSTEQAHPFEAKLLDELAVEFRETMPLPPMAQAMIVVEHAHDKLKLLSASAWQPTAEHPALVATHEALLLREAFTELLRTDDVQAHPAGFVELMRAGETAAEQLEKALQSPPSDTATAAANEAFAKVTQNCADCHKQFRDVPLNEKQKR